MTSSAGPDPQPIGTTVCPQEPRLLVRIERHGDGGHVADVARKSALLATKLAGLSQVRQVRGAGLLLAAVLDWAARGAITSAESSTPRFTGPGCMRTCCGPSRRALIW